MLTARHGQGEIEKVTLTGGTTSHWVMRTGDTNSEDTSEDKDTKDKTIEWDSEVLMDEPGRRIAWRSIGGESDNAGEVVFEPAPGGRGAMVTVLQEFRMGKLSSLWETIVGRNPKQAVIENLRHFKALAETGEIPQGPGPAPWPARIGCWDQEIDVWREHHYAARVKPQSELSKVLRLYLLSSELE